MSEVDGWNRVMYVSVSLCFVFYFNTFPTSFSGVSQQEGLLILKPLYVPSYFF